MHVDMGNRLAGSPASRPRHDLSSHRHRGHLGLELFVDVVALGLDDATAADGWLQAE